MCVRVCVCVCVCDCLGGARGAYACVYLYMRIYMMNYSSVHIFTFTRTCPHRVAVAATAVIGTLRATSPSWTRPWSSSAGPCRRPSPRGDRRDPRLASLGSSHRCDSTSIWDSGFPLRHLPLALFGRRALDLCADPGSKPCRTTVQLSQHAGWLRRESHRGVVGQKRQ